MNKRLLSIWTIAFLLLAGCAPSSGQRNVASSAGQPAASVAGGQAISRLQQPVAAATSTGETQTHASQVDLTHLPLGDGHVSSQPQTGSIWACQTSFNGRGADHLGDWVNGDGTFDLTKKPTVDGAVNWPSSFTISLQDDARVISGNDLPDHATGNFPISSSDDAYAYDRNPNSIQGQSLRLSLPATPSLAAQAHCLNGGPIGVLLSGAYLFDALDAAGHDAVAHEVQDDCQGHPERTGQYHYHDLTSCLPDTLDANGNSPLVGYALDGFGIFGPVENGQTLASADLDECHGRTSEIEWDGQRVVMYHYIATADYPYTLGCFRGTPVRAGQGGQPQPNGAQPGQDGQQRPQIDLASAAATLGVSEDALRAALGDPSQGRPDLAAAAAQLGVSEEQLIAALGLPPRPSGGPGADAPHNP